MEEESSSYDAAPAEIIAAEVLTSLLPERATWLELGGSKRTNTNTSSSSSSKRFGLPLLRWGCKRRRSAIGVPVSVSWPRHHHSSHPQPPPPPPKAEASSPATPLSFSPSESDDKDKDKDKDNPTLHLPSYLSLKRKREHYLKIIQDIKKDNDSLAGEIKNVKRYYERVKDFNLKLKARKLELSNGPNQRAPPSPQTRESEGVAAAQCQNHDEASCGQPTTSFGVASPSGSGSALGMGNRDTNNVGPFGIPDLNLPPEEEEEEEEFMGVGAECCEALDNKNNVSRALAAQARQKRIQICRLKNPRNSCR